MNGKIILYGLILFSLVLHGNSALAVFTINIDEGVERGIPIAIVPFGNELNELTPYSIDSIIREDLSRTGRFDPLPVEQYLSLPTAKEEIHFNDWQLIGADYVLIGRVEPIEEEAGRFRIIARLFDAFDQKQVFARQFNATMNQVREYAHLIADRVFENLIEKKSSFLTSILYTVTVPSDDSGPPDHVLYTADYDGFNPKVVLRSKKPILSPSWSPDNSQIVYAELGGSESKIYVQTVTTGERFLLSTPAGYSSAPSWSPDGRRIAFSNSTNGNYDIYIYSLDSGNITQVTKHRLIDTEPAWSPDGKHIVFTSNRGARPQIYQTAARRNTNAKPLLIAGRSNTGASYSPNGNQLVVITDQGNGSQVGVYDFATRSIRVLSKTSLDDSAEFSPYGDMLIHIVEGQERYIKILSPDGRVQSRIPVAEGRVKQVDWSSF